MCPPVAPQWATRAKWGPCECPSAPTGPEEGKDGPAISGEEFADDVSGRYPLIDGGEDFQRVKAVVDALLGDHARLESMAPLEHLAWAWSLPQVETRSELPDSTVTAVDHCRQGNGRRLHALRADALAYWRQRKRYLAPAWERHLRTLEPHVQSVLGKGKNLFLLKARARLSPVGGS